MLFDPAGHQLSRGIWSLTWPLMVANALELAVGLIDLWLVRPFGPAATAAIGVGRQVTFLVEAVAVAITAGVITLVSQGMAARCRPVPSAPGPSRDSPLILPSPPSDGGEGRVRGGSTVPIVDPDKVVRQSVGLVLLIGLPTTLLGYWLSEPLLVCLQAGAETRAYGAPYLQVYFAGLLFTWGSLVSAALFRGTGDVWMPLKVALGVSLFQVVLDYVFIYGAGPLPAFEVQGAAMGAVCARGCGTVVFLFLLLRGTGPLRLRWSSPVGPASRAGPGGEVPRAERDLPSSRGLDWKLIGSLLRIGVPMALANLLRHGSRVVFLAIAGASALGVSLQAAVGVALQVRLISILVALAFQTASATLVGQAIGRDDFHQAEVLGRRSVQLLALLMGFISGMLLVLADPLAALFLIAPEGSGLGARVLRWFAVAQFFSATSIGIQGVLLGAGDTRPALRYTLVSEWCLLLPLSYCLVVLDWVPDGLLAAWVLAPALTLALMQRRFRSGRWKPSRGK
ncbi:MAG: MATE family efflux transporter [Planctomycetes bacterium]|nr:MATE family efflux transporter [Planctomycetota bacterium]